ncbi:MAG: DUF3025 domain-containing protein [Lysobacteraceae bacterium]
MAKRRFIAPDRRDVPEAVFQHPAFAPYAAQADFLCGGEWPSVAMLNARAQGLRHAHTQGLMRFVRQDSELLADGMHYEDRIYAHSEIPTRAMNWHDLLNAVIWLRWSRMKSALNRRQVDDIVKVGPRQRTRAQCALTHFDEAGVAVRISDDIALAHWDAHEWPLLARRLRTHPTGCGVIVFGHAVLEHALDPSRLLVGKALLVRAEDSLASDEWMASIAERIACGDALNDPLELRPLPLAVLPGWHAQSTEDAFLHTAPCFQPLRQGRHYPPPLAFTAALSER